MLARLRSFLDEATADIFNDTTELYPALSLAQLELTQTVAKHWDVQKRKQMQPIPLVIRDLTINVSATINLLANSFQKLGIILPIAMRWNPDGAVATGKQCILANGSGDFLRLLDNRLLSDGYYYWLMGGVVYVNPASADNGATYDLEYVNTPVDISSSVQPVTHEVGHDAIIERACWILLKDRESEQAQAHLQMYGNLLQGLV